MRLERCSDVMMKLLYFILPSSSNTGFPSPPSRGAKLNSFPSFSVTVIPPVMAGISLVRITYIRNKFGYNLLIAQDLWQAHCQILSIIHEVKCKYG